MTISSGDYLKVFRATDSELVAHKLSRAAATDDYGIALRATDGELVLMKVSPATALDDKAFVRRATDGELVLVKSELELVETVLLNIFIKLGPGKADRPDGNVFQASIDAYANLLALGSWGGSSFGLVFNWSGGTVFGALAHRVAEVSSSANLTQPQVDNIVGAAVAKVTLELAIRKEPDFGGFADQLPPSPVRINLSTSATTYGSPALLYAVTEEGSLSAVRAGVCTASGSEYSIARYVFGGLDVTKFEEVTTADKIYLWFGIHGDAAPDLVTEAQGDPWRYEASEFVREPICVTAKIEFFK